MRFQEIDYLRFKKQDLARVARNDAALRSARMAAKIDGVPFVEADFVAPEAEPDDIVYAGGRRLLRVTLERGDEHLTPEQMAEKAREFLGAYGDEDAA